MKKSVLIINANLQTAKEIQNHLLSPDTDVICVADVSGAIKAFVQKEFCLVVLDADISAQDDHLLLKVMRKARTSPILILSSCFCREERLELIRKGAHAYIGEPYSLDECLAQAKALMQLYCDLKQHEICYTLAFGKNLVIDPQTRQVVLGGRELKLTPKEFDLLFCLASNPEHSLPAWATGQ